MSELKEIPTKGTRLKYNIEFVKTLFTCCVLILIYILFIDVSDSKFEQIKWLLVFGFSGSGIALGIYTASENGIKHSTAVMNK